MGTRLGKRREGAGSKHRRHPTLSFSRPAAEDVIPDVPDGLLWSCALARHSSGDVSFAVARSNNPCEDRSEVESGSFGTYVGVYDGHGGPQAAQFCNENLFACTRKAVSDMGGATSEALREAMQAVEEKFLDVVRSSWLTKPQMASVGSCVLAGMVSDGLLHVLSLGDSRAILGRRKSLLLGGGVSAVELSVEHNANNQEEREKLKRSHPAERDIVVDRGGVWRVKGIIQVTRSMGDFYLKRPEFQRPPLSSRFLLPGGLKLAALSAEPSIKSVELSSSDRFVVFASDGLWEHVKPSEACSVVAKHPRMGIARRLAKLALFRACKVQDLRLSQLPRVDPAQRRQVHDDISVIVLFFDFSEGQWGTGAAVAASSSASKTAQAPPMVSLAAPAKAAGDGAQGSNGQAQEDHDPLVLSLKGLSDFTPCQMKNQLKKDVIAENFYH